MEDLSLIKLIAEKAIAHLAYDDAHPDVGWGMTIHTAVELAEKDILVEAARWNSIEALRLDCSRVRDAVFKEVYDYRMNR